MTGSVHVPVWVLGIAGAIVLCVLGKCLGDWIGSPWFASRQRRQMLKELRRRDRGQR